MRFLQLLYTLPLLKFPTEFTFDPGFICVRKLYVALQAHHDNVHDIHGMLLFRKHSSDDIAAPWHRYKMKSY